MPEFTLKHADKSDLARKIREAIGVGAKDDVLVRTPVFDRSPNWPAVEAAPAEWEALRGLTRKQLQRLGCGSWDGRLMLFPREWYDQIPEGYALECINGEVEPFQRGKTDDDVRFGLLAYGVPAMDGKKVAET